MFTFNSSRDNILNFIKNRTAGGIPVKMNKEGMIPKLGLPYFLEKIINSFNESFVNTAGL
jgi:hypothetical protein